MNNYWQWIYGFFLYSAPAIWRFPSCPELPVTFRIGHVAFVLLN